MLHNAHAQRVPMQLLPGTHFPSAGTYLAADYGTDYLALGITAHTGSTTDVRLDAHARDGFEVVTRPLNPPAEDSIEQAIASTTPHHEPVLLDLRPARGSAGPTSIRHANTHIPVDVLTAFDGLACLPAMKPSILTP